MREQRAVTSSTGSDGLHAKRPNVGIDQQHMDCPRGEKSEKIGEEEAVAGSIEGAIAWHPMKLQSTGGVDQMSALSTTIYSRAHEWQFDGGAHVHASASPHVVRAPFSDPSGVDPEEAFVAALASCHMLFFLAFAAKHGFAITEYEDNAVGVMLKTSDGREWMTKATLRPRGVHRRQAADRRRGRRASSPGARGLLHCELGQDGSRDRGAG